ncbi:MAG: hypothetical protein KGL39_08990 [Patescibacteria group bacterium]|nr:hypothetical protein [Patescibacteria group bacterium]
MKKKLPAALKKDEFKKGAAAKPTGLSKASERMKEEGTVGKFTDRAGGKAKIGKQIAKDLKPGSKASATAKKEANFARMARRGWKPLKKNEKK